MAATAVLALGAGALMLLAAGARRGGTTRGRQVACDATPDAARGFSRASLLSWVDCTGRTAEEVASLASLLERAGRRTDATAVRERWNARRDVEDSPPDGVVPEAASALTSAPPATPPEEPATRRGRVVFPGASDIERVDASSSSSSRRRVPASDLGGYDPGEARRLAPQVARSLRSGGGYRTALTNFQRAAGIAADGLYGPESRAALRFYGVSDPPPARVNRRGTERYTPPVVEMDPISASEDGGGS